jgi:hypothetical protein
MKNIIKQGPAVIRAHLDHLRNHHQDAYVKEALECLKEAGQPKPYDRTGRRGSRDFRRSAVTAQAVAGAAAPCIAHGGLFQGKRCSFDRRLRGICPGQFP